MLRAVLFGLVATPLISTLVLQIPLVSSRKDEQAAVLSDDDRMEWSFEKGPNPNVTDHLVFETVYSLLQHWPNTRMRSGHTVVPGTIPKGTLFYHGAERPELPLGPDWVSYEPEHSQFFCQDIWKPLDDSQLGCWHATLAPTRPLKVLYFDGNSAAKLEHGPLDSQDLLAWGESRPDNVWKEMSRIIALCKWGKNFGVDGFVRMEISFEVMLCDFTSGVNVVSWLNLVRERGIPTSVSDLVIASALFASSLHNRLPGETRVQLDLAELVSFYDTQLVPSLVAIRVGQERWDHRVRNISSEDLSAVKSRLEAALTRPSPSSGIDWKTLIQVIMDRFAGRLELVRHLLSLPTTDQDAIFDLASKTQAQLRVMLKPYILFSVTPWEIYDLGWAEPIYMLCATTHTNPMESELDSMTDSEKLIIQAVRGTTREICRVVTKMWASGVYAGLDSLLNKMELLDIVQVTRVWNDWAKDLNHLMAWLDWSVWVKCDPACGPEEMCYLPTWPLGFPLYPFENMPKHVQHGPDRQQKGLSSLDLPIMTAEHLFGKVSSTNKLESDEWFRPQPKCIRQFNP